jgi:anti-sigma factor RsiW
VLLLIHDPRPDDGGGEPARRRRRLPAPPWRPFAWVAAFCWLLFAAGELGGLAGYVVLLVAVGVGAWRLDRWLGRQYWGGLREVQR